MCMEEQEHRDPGQVRSFLIAPRVRRTRRVFGSGDLKTMVRT